MSIINSGIKDLWGSINGGGEKEEIQKQAFELSRRLFESGLSDTSMLKAMSKDDLTKLLFECQKLCRAAQQFLTDALPHIDPEFKGQSLEGKLAGLRDSLGVTVANVARILDANQKFFEAEDELRRGQQDLQTLKARVAELEEMEKEVQPERITDELAKASGKEDELISKVLAGLNALVDRLKSPSATLHLKANQKVMEDLRQAGKAIPVSVTERIARIQKELDELDGELKNIIIPSATRL